jgi:hypothetical protein
MDDIGRYRRKVACAGYCLVTLLGVLTQHPECQAQDSGTAFHFENLKDGSLKLWQGQQPVFVYHSQEVKRMGPAAVGNRASYVHPIFGLEGEVITDDFPKDHYHHHGLFWGWPHVTIAGKDYDFWKMKGASIRFKRWVTREADAKRAVLAVENEWLVGDKPVVREEARLLVHPATPLGRLIDVRLKWTPLDEAITLVGAEGKSYGGVSLRFAPREDTVITVPSGPTTADLLITKLPWADLSAKFQGAKEISGAALFVEPHHPGFPLEWMTRAYGLLAAGWPGVKSHTIESRKTVTCNYGVWVHRGRVEAARIQREYEAFAGGVERDE